MYIVRIYTLSTADDPNNIRYVGKTTQNLKRRLQGHICDAKKSKRLKETTNHNYNWIIKILEEGHEVIINELDCMEFENPDEWKWLEQYWISQMRIWGFNLTNIRPGGEDNYNKTPTQEVIEKRAAKIRGIPRDEETKRKISKGLTGIVRSEETRKKVSNSITKLQGKPVNQYNIKTKELIKTWESGADAANTLGIDKTNLNSCCRGKKKSAGGYIWKYASDTSKISIKENPYEVKQYTLNGDYLATFDNSNKASIETGIEYGLIRKCCLKEIHHAKNFVFLFSTEDIANYQFPGNNIFRKREINQYDLYHNFIQTFKSATEAGKVLKLDRKTITKCCKGEIKIYKNYIFEYND